MEVLAAAILAALHKAAPQGSILMPSQATIDLLAQLAEGDLLNAWEGNIWPAQQTYTRVSMQ